MKFYFSFPHNLFYYDCSRCRAHCCHSGGELLMSDAIAQLIKKEYPLIAKYFFVPNQNKLIIKEACWFLSKNLKCLIERNFSKSFKPLSCQLFPFQALQGPEDYLIIKFVPCPGIQRNVSKRGLHYEKQIKSLIQRFPSLIQLTSTTKNFPKTSLIDKSNIIIWEKRFLLEQAIRDVDPEKIKKPEELIERYTAILKNILSCKIINHSIKTLSKIVDINYLLAFLVPQFRMEPWVLKMDLLSSWKATIKFIEKFVLAYSKLRNTETGIINAWILSTMTKSQDTFLNSTTPCCHDNKFLDSL